MISHKVELSITELIFGRTQENMDLLFCHCSILSTWMVHVRISNALLAATLQMEENRLWSIKMKLDVSTALKSKGEKKLFLGHFVVVNWSEQLAVMQVIELLFSFHLRVLWVCVCVSKHRGGTKVQEEQTQPDDSQNDKNIMLGHCLRICLGVSLLFKHLHSLSTKLQILRAQF